MKLYTYVPGVLCLLLSGALGAPTEPSQRQPAALPNEARGDELPPSDLEKRDLTVTWTSTGANAPMCDTSTVTYQGYTIDTSAKAGDCLNMFNHFRNDALGYYTVTGWTDSTYSSIATLYTSGSCQFQIYPRSQAAFDADPNALGNWYFGNSDIYQMVSNSLNKYSSGGRVWAAGGMNCSGNGVTHEIIWRVWGYAPKDPF